MAEVTLPVNLKHFYAKSVHQTQNTRENSKNPDTLF